MRRSGGWRRRLAVVGGLVAGLVPLVPEPAAAATTTLTVTSAADSGAGTLRQVLLDAQAIASDVEVRIPAAVADITLTSGDLEYTGTHLLRLVGAGQTITQTVAGQRVLTTTTSLATVVDGLELTGGSTGAGECGGAVRAVGPVAIVRSVLHDNASTCGGGGLFTAGDGVSIVDSTIADNDGGIIGGGIYAPSATVIAQRSTISGNHAQFGGGVLARRVVVEQITVSGNSATTVGGGVYAKTVSLLQSTVSGNTAGSSGGGVVASAEEGGDGVLYLVTTTVAGNSAPSAANLSAVTLRAGQSIVADAGGGGSGCVITGSASAAGGRNLGEDESCGFTLPAQGDLQGVDPQLGPLADNGGPTRTHLPAATSPVVDAVPSNRCDGTADQRDFVRPFGAGCDIGAVEVGARPVTRTFTGTIDKRWSHPGNWSPSGVPTDGADVVIPANGIIELDLPDVVVRNATLGNGVFIATANPPAGGPLTVSGDLITPVGGSSTVLPVVSFPAGAHEVRAGNLVLAEIAGDGAVSFVGTGLTTLIAAPGFTGPITVGTGMQLATRSLGTDDGGVTLQPGAEMLAWSEPDPEAIDFGDDVVVLDGPAAAVLDIQARRFTGDIDLQGDLSIGRPGGTFGNQATYTGAISGPGALTLRGNAAGTFVVDGANTYAGGTTVNGRVGLVGSSPLGTGAVAMTSAGRLDLTDGSVPNAISYPSTPTTPPGPEPFLTFTGTAAVTGAVTITGTEPVAIGLAAGAEAVVGPGFTTAGRLRATPTGEPSTGDRRLTIAGGASIGQLAASDVSVTLAPGATSVGAVDLDAGSQVPALQFGSNGQHLAATPMGGGGLLDLRGTDQAASAVTITAPGSLRLGRREAPADPSTLTVSGALTSQSGSVLAVLLAPGGADQIRAQSASIGGAVLDVAVDGLPAVGQGFRIVDVTGAAAVQGTFAGLPEGATVPVGQQRYRISYVGGTGNDVTLTRIADPASTWNFAGPVDHGGRLLGAPALSSWGAGRVDGWVVGIDQAVWHRFSQVGGGSGWESLGGITRSTPAAVSQVPGEVDLFVRGADDALWMRSYRGGWGPWTSLGGILTSGPSVTSPSPGNLVVAARGNDGAVWIRRMVGGTWQGWTSLGGGTPNAPTITDWGDGRIDVFIRGLDGALWQRALIGGVPTDWISHGGVLTHAPAAAAPESNQLVVFIRGADGVVWLRAWDGAAWIDWRSLGIVSADGPGAAGVAPGDVQLGIRVGNSSLVTHRGTQGGTPG